MKSLKKNYVMNLIKTTLGIIFPLITYPYVSRILSPTGLGQVNFSQSFTNYFILIATFGINNFAIREGAKFRDDKRALGKFATEMLIINICTAVISYILLFISINFSTIENYRHLVLIFSLTILFNIVGMEWIFQLFEEYQYITLRAIGFQIISLILLFSFVKDANDIMTYCLIIVFSSVGSQLLNFFRLRKMVELFGYKGYNFTTYIKPMIIIFLSILTMNLYQYIDVTLLGVMKGDTSVGLYTLSTRIIKILMTMISSITVILTPRLAYYHKNSHIDEFKKLIQFSGKFILIIAIPITLGVFLLSDNVIMILGGEAFMKSSITIKIICVEIIFASLNGLIATPILTVMNREFLVLKIFVIGLLTNVSLNYLFISVMDYNGAALSTVITEFLILVLCLYFSKDIFKIKTVLDESWKYLVACLPIIVIWILVHSLIGENFFVEFCVVTIIGGVSYVLCLFLLKERTLLELTKSMTFIKRK